MTKTINLSLTEEEVQTLKNAANLLLDIADAFTSAEYPIELKGIDNNLLSRLLNYYQSKSAEVLNSHLYLSLIEDTVAVE